MHMMKEIGTGQKKQSCIAFFLLKYKTHYFYYHVEKIPMDTSHQIDKDQYIHSPRNNTIPELTSPDSPTIYAIFFYFTLGRFGQAVGLVILV